MAAKMKEIERVITEIQESIEAKSVHLKQRKEFYERRQTVFNEFQGGVLVRFSFGGGSPQSTSEK